jgi:hypothetical protein
VACGKTVALTAPLAKRGASRYIRRGIFSQISGIMRAETYKLVEEIKQSVGLLRRHL